MNKRGNMAKKQAIFDYWKNCEFTGVDIGLDDPDEYQMTTIKKEHLSTCFKCNLPCGTVRAHILPIQFGGSNEPENLHLLCNFCHMQSENLWGEKYWDWFFFFFNTASHPSIQKAMFVHQKFIESGSDDLESFVHEYLAFSIPPVVSPLEEDWPIYCLAGD